MVLFSALRKAWAPLRRRQPTSGDTPECYPVQCEHPSQGLPTLRLIAADDDAGGFSASRLGGTKSKAAVDAMLLEDISESVVEIVRTVTCRSPFRQ
jgi:hypothetical protein